MNILSMHRSHESAKIKYHDFIKNNAPNVVSANRNRLTVTLKNGPTVFFCHTSDQILGMTFGMVFTETTMRSDEQAQVLERLR